MTLFPKFKYPKLKSYRLKSPKLKSLGPKKGAIIILVILLFVVLNLTGFSKGVKNFFYLISSPIQKVLWQKGSRTSNFFEILSKINSLNKENEELKLKNQDLLARVISLKELEKENEILREALELNLQEDFKLILGEIISKDISCDSILINKGSKDGVIEGEAVITQQKILLGRVSEVYENFSRVMLITNTKSSFDGEVQEKNITGIVKGKGNSRLFFDLIPQSQEISEGDIVTSSVLGGVFPKGLLVGRIKEIKKNDVKPYQKAEISPFFSLKKINFLFIITEY